MPTAATFDRDRMRDEVNEYINDDFLYQVGYGDIPDEVARELERGSVAAGEAIGSIDTEAVLDDLSRWSPVPTSFWKLDAAVRFKTVLTHCEFIDTEYARELSEYTEG